MEQRNREFAPHILAVPVGSTVAFPNFDTIYHNVFSRSEAAPFDLGIYSNGQSRELTFDKDGIVRLGCNLHSNMSAYVVVVSRRTTSSPTKRASSASAAWSRASTRRALERAHAIPSAHEIVVEARGEHVLALDVAGRTGRRGDRQVRSRAWRRAA